ncbi:MAG: tetratricopeptide repeat protein [Ignavibacteria bacterium]|nr:tetratricopeptide repeat protein [Ignavibacteria bacterium]
MKMYISFAAALILAVASTSAQWIVMDPTADSLIKAGTRHVYNVEFDEAQRIFNDVTARYPNQPAGFFVDAMIDWWRLTIGQRSPAIEASFLTKIDRVIAVCDRQLHETPKDILALFFKGGALGYRGRFHATKQNMFSAAEDGRTALSILQDCQRLAPTNHDILLGTGLYNYWAAVLPEQYPALKPVMVFLPRGDKTIGLAQLKSAGRLARYASVEAKVVLLDAYMYFEKNYLEALDFAIELRNTYPGNPKFHIEYARSLTYLWRVEDAYKSWDEILDCNYRGKAGYMNRYIVREALYNMGSLLFHQNKEIPTAIAYLDRCVKESKVIDKQKISWQYPWALVRLGQVHDMQGKRQEAIAFYKQVLAIDNSSTKSYEAATKYLASPYKR